MRTLRQRRRPIRDCFPKFADHAEAIASLAGCGIAVSGQLACRDTINPDGLLVLKPVGGACDGLVYAPTGETRIDAGGVVYWAMEAVEGYHLNLRLADGGGLPAALQAHRVMLGPETPAERVTSGE
ncbi:hypothetical protein [Martelella radicis]|uniref:Uncharacterized protein n=1 Tax=Martelella radicis TaxID=1397476 RepID=A0A7W6P9S8_9HYPH|nr:hypothetical protein [Martelella radicis]MBB4122125.1 hypothetical protein [Martelella radicis]